MKYSVKNRQESTVIRSSHSIFSNCEVGETEVENSFLSEDDELLDEELVALIEKDVENVQKTPKDGVPPGGVPHTERTRFKVVEKGKNHFDVLPHGWIVIDHVSGMPLYLHRGTRSVTLSRPYHLGTASARVSFHIISNVRRVTVSCRS